MAGMWEPGSCDESDEDSGSKKTTPPYSNPPSTDTSERELAPAGRGRGRGGGRAMDNRVDLPSEDEEDVHLAQRQGRMGPRDADVDGLGEKAPALHGEQPPG